ncbi:ADP-ribosylglycohydrolase family protein [Blastococcus sp. SYSU DS0552]
MHRSHRVMGALAGSAVGDALGARFAAGAPGQFSARFPEPARGSRTEMCGGPDDREPGEFTDRTQRALLVGRSLLERDGPDEADLVAAGSNGSLALAVPAAIWGARSGAAASADAARRISALTSGDPATGEGCVLFAELLRVALDGGDPLASIAAALSLVADEQRWAAVLAPGWTPDQAGGPGGAVEPVLGAAVWALRRGRSFAEVLRLGVDLGGDTGTVACVAGALAGAVFGMGGIPMRWASAVHGRAPGTGDRVGLADLQELATLLDGKPWVPNDPGVIPRIGPAEVLPGIWAGNLDGARFSERDFAVISLCKLGEPFGHPVHRVAHIADTEHNPGLDAVLADVLDDMAALHAEGHRLLVHCHGGASRTGLVLRGWLVREKGMSVEEATAHVAERWPHLGLWNESFTAALQRLAAARVSPSAG